MKGNVVLKVAKYKKACRKLCLVSVKHSMEQFPELARGILPLIELTSFVENKYKPIYEKRQIETKRDFSMKTALLAMKALITANYKLVAARGFDKLVSARR